MENINKHIEDKIQIDERKILVPAKIKNIAVQNDHNSEVAKIVIPRYFEDRDLSAYSIMLKAVSRGGRSEVLFKETEIEVFEEEIELTWVLKVPITSFSGIVKIQISVFGEDFKWQTQVAEVNIIKALDDTPIIPDQLDFIENFVVTTENKVKEMEECVDEIKKDIIYIEGKIEEAEHNASQSGSNLEQTTVIMQQVQGYKKEVENMKSQIEQIQEEVNEVKDSFEQLVEVKKQEIVAEGSKQIELVANIGEECVALTQAEVAKAQEQANIAKGHASTAKQQAMIASDKAKEATQQATISKEQAEIAKSQVALTTEQANIAKSQVALATEQANIAKQQATEATKQVGLAKQEVTKATDKANTATKQATKAQQQADIAVQKVEEINEKVLEITSLVEDAQSSVSTATTQVEEIKKQVELAKQQVQLVNDKTEEVKGEVEKAKGHANTASQQATIATEKANIATQKALEATNQVPLATEQANIAKQKATEATNQATEATKQVGLAKAQVSLATEQAVIATEQTAQAVEQVELAKQEVAKVSEAIGRLDAKDTEQDKRLTQLENEPSSNVLFGEGEQDKFNFVKNEVIQDGLVGYFKKTNESKTFTANEAQVTLVSSGWLEVGDRKTGAFVLAKAKGFLVGIDSSGVWYASGGGIDYSGIGLGTAKSGSFFIEIEIDKLNVAIKVITDNKTVIKQFELKQIESNVCSFLHMYSGEEVKNSYCNGFVYNRPLSPQEIEHNLSVLNNTDSIKSLEVTKGDTTTSYNFATTENHVEMSTGRTLHDEYMGVLKGFGEEITSADGSDKVVENGLEARVISGEISGRTIKNDIKNPDFKTDELFKSNYGNLTKVDGVCNVSCDGNGKNICFIGGLIPVENRTDKYYSSIDICVHSYESGNPRTLIGIFGEGYDTSPLELKSLQRGQYVKCSNVFSSPYEQWIGKRISIKVGSLENFNSSYSFKNPILVNLTKLFGQGNEPTKEECDKLFNGFLPFGLSSTQAIIANNGQEYKFYEPTIQGKTKILNGEGQEVQAGANGAKLVSLKPNDNAPYELGSTLNISDTIDIENKILTVNTIEIELDGTEDWKFYDVVPESHRQMYVQPIENLAIYNDSSINCLSNHFKSCAFKDRTNPNTLNHIFVSRNLIAVMREKTETVEQWKQYLAQQKASDNPVKVRYQLETAINIQLTDEQFKQYESYKKVILLDGVNKDKDTLEILEQGDAILTKKTLSMNIDPNLIRVGTENEAFITCVQSASNIDIPKTAWEKDEGICNIFKWNKNYGNNPNCIAISSNKNISFTLPKEVCATFEEVKEYVKKNKIEIICALETPKKIHIPKELVKPIKTHLTNKISVGGTVKPSSYKLTLPVNKLSDFEKRLQALESATVDVILNK